MKVDRKEGTCNCLGNTSWFLDAFLTWVKEMIEDGDYFPGAHVRKASREEVEDFVMRTRCNVRVMQAIIDAGRRYEELDNGIDEEGLIDLNKEVCDLYESIEELLRELCDDDLNLVATGHPALNYLSGPVFHALCRTGYEMQQDFCKTIIPPTKG